MHVVIAMAADRDEPLPKEIFSQQFVGQAFYPFNPLHKISHPLLKDAVEWLCPKLPQDALRPVPGRGQIVGYLRNEWLANMKTCVLGKWRPHVNDTLFQPSRSTTQMNTPSTAIEQKN